MTSPQRLPVPYRLLIQGPQGPSLLRFSDDDGDLGRPLRIDVRSAGRIEIQDAGSGAGPLRILARRRGSALLVFLGATDFPDLILDRFFGSRSEPVPELTGRRSDGTLHRYVIDLGLRSGPGAVSESLTPLALEGGGWWSVIPGWLRDPGAGPAGPAAAVPGPASAPAASSGSRPEGSVSASGTGSGKWWMPIGGGLGLLVLLLGRSGTPPEPILTLEGTFAPALAVQDARLTLKSLSGSPLASTVPPIAGVWRLSLPAIPVSDSLLRLDLLDGNGSAGDYRDPFSGRLRSLDTALRAFLTFADDPSQYANGRRSGLFPAHLSPISELLVRLVESGSGPESATPGAQAMITVRNALAQFLGLRPEALSSAALALQADGAPFAEAAPGAASGPLGLLLLEWSALQTRLGGSLDLVLGLLAEGLDWHKGAWVADPLVKALLEQARELLSQHLDQALGREQANEPGAYTLHRRLTGRVELSGQLTLGDGRLEVTGAGTPGQSLKVRMPDGSVVAATIDGDGRFLATSVLAQDLTLQPAALEYQDALARNVKVQAPVPPSLLAANGRVLAGMGIPGHAVRVESLDGTILAEADVDDLGYWRISLDPGASPSPAGWVVRSLSQAGHASRPIPVTVDGSVPLLAPAAELADRMADALLSDAELASLQQLRFTLQAGIGSAVIPSAVLQVRRPDGSLRSVGPDAPDSGTAAHELVFSLPADWLTLDGRYELAAVAAGDGASLGAVDLPIEFLLDRQAPAAPVGLQRSGFLLSGRIEPGADLLWLDPEGRIVARHPVGSDGSFIVDVEGSSINGIAAIDAAGQRGPATAWPEASAALAIVAALDLKGARQGVATSGSMIDEPAPRLLGRLTRALTPGEGVEVWQFNHGMTPQWVGSASVSGLTISHAIAEGLPLDDGDYRWRFRLVDPSRADEAVWSNDFSLTIDTTGAEPRSLRIPDIEVGSPVINLQKLTDRGGLLLRIGIGGPVEVGDLVELRLAYAGQSVRSISRPISAEELPGRDLSLTIPVGAGLSDGQYTAFAKLVSMRTGRVSAELATGFSIDVTPPTLSGGLDPGPFSDTGHPADGLTARNLPLLSGVTEPGLRVELELAGRSLETRSEADGRWSIQWPGSAPLSDGVYTAQASVIDAAGNVSRAALRSFRVDTVIDPGTAALAAGSDSGIPGDGLTAQNRPVIEGLAEPGARVRLGFQSGQEIVPWQVETTSDPLDGRWRVDLALARRIDNALEVPGLGDGRYIPVLQVEDPAGNQARIEGSSFTVDTTPPLPPLIELGTYAISGAPAFFGGGDVVPNPHPAVLIRADRLSVIDVFEAESGLLGSAAAQVSDEDRAPFTFGFAEPLLPGAYSLTAVAEDLAGNRSPPSLPFGFTVVDPVL